MLVLRSSFCSGYIVCRRLWKNQDPHDLGILLSFLKETNTEQVILRVKQAAEIPAESMSPSNTEKMPTEAQALEDNLHHQKDCLFVGWLLNVQATC